MARGVFVTFEGGEGTGKSTQMRLLAERLAGRGVETLAVREPGGTPVGDRIRHVLLDPDGGGMDAVSELLLYEASRRELVVSVILPALEAGTVVLCDRFYDSTTAYQGHARGLDLAMVRELNSLASAGLVPDLTLLLDVDPLLGLERATRGVPGATFEGADRLEREDLEFHSAVRKGFLRIAEQEGARFAVVDASTSVEDVAEQVWTVVLEHPAFAGVLH